MSNFKKDPPPDKKSFLLYCDQSELIQKLSDEQAGNLIKQIYSYCGNGRKRPEITDPLTDIVFTALQTSLDRDHKKYLKIVERNRNNGQLGGRPKKNPVGSLGTQKTQVNPKNPSEPDSDSDSVNGKDIPPLPPKGKSVSKKQQFKNYLKAKIENTSFFSYEKELCDFIDYRMSMTGRKKYQTEKGIDGLLTCVGDLVRANLDPLVCLPRCMEEEWLKPKPEYFNNGYDKNQETDEEYAKRVGYS